MRHKLEGGEISKKQEWVEGVSKQVVKVLTDQPGMAAVLRHDIITGE